MDEERSDPPDPTEFAISCPEKIIFCIDLNGEDHPPMSAVPSDLDSMKSAAIMFAYVKAKMNPLHEFSLVVLLETAVTVLDFTSDVNTFVASVSNLKPAGTFSTFDISSLFNSIHDQAASSWIPITSPKRTPFVIRTILLYNRSNVVPTLEDNQSWSKLIQYKNFFFDAMFLHEKPSETCNPQAVYDFITELEPPPPGRFSYFFEGTKSARRALQSLAKLLAHPEQRPFQAELNASLYSTTPHIAHPPPLSVPAASNSAPNNNNNSSSSSHSTAAAAAVALPLSSVSISSSQPNLVPNGTATQANSESQKSGISL